MTTVSPSDPAPQDGTQARVRPRLYAVLSGLMLTASQPPAGLDWMAWFALVPLLKAAEGASCSRAFSLGVTAGLAHYLTLLYWLVVVLGRYGNLPSTVSVGALVAVCLYLSIYVASFSTVVSRLGPHGFEVPLTTAACWVAFEFIRARVGLAFPWCLLGYSMHGRPLLIQIADVTGVYGISFLIALVNAFLYHLLSARSCTRAGIFAVEGALVTVALGATLVYGHRTIDGAHREAPSGSIRTAIIQGNIDQSVKWEPSYQAATMATYLERTESAVASGTDLIVWPETSLPFFFQDRTDWVRALRSLSTRSGASLLFGSPAYTAARGKTSYFNRAYLITPEGGRPLHYDKVHLVPFGEYVPCKRLLFFIERLVPAAGDFAPGRGVAPLASDRFSAGVLICFEAIFPELARKHALAGASLLVNLTNDAWFGHTSAPYQHLSMAVFRAIETRLPMVRAANTGFSAFISPLGEIRARTELFEAQSLLGTLPLPPAHTTIYSRVGDAFALGMLALTAVVFVFRLRRARKRGRV